MPYVAVPLWVPMVMVAVVVARTLPAQTNKRANPASQPNSCLFLARRIVKFLKILSGAAQISTTALARECAGEVAIWAGGVDPDDFLIRLFSISDFKICSRIFFWLTFLMPAVFSLPCGASIFHLRSSVFGQSAQVPFFPAVVSRLSFSYRFKLLRRKSPRADRHQPPLRFRPVSHISINPQLFQHFFFITPSNPVVVVAIAKRSLRYAQISTTRPSHGCDPVETPGWNPMEKRGKSAKRKARGARRGRFPLRASRLPPAAFARLSKHFMFQTTRLRSELRRGKPAFARSYGGASKILA